MNQWDDSEERFDEVDFDAFAPFYDADYRNYNQDLQLIVDLAQMSGERCLELGCGSGRALLPPAAAGHFVVGVDGSAAMLALARQKTQSPRLTGHVELIHDDLRTFRIEKTPFDFAYCVSDTLMHLPTRPINSPCSSTHSDICVPTGCCWLTSSAPTSCG